MRPRVGYSTGPGKTLRPSRVRFHRSWQELNYTAKQKEQGEGCESHIAVKGKRNRESNDLDR